ncbi:MAG: hypothetical protein KGO96_06920 [Elusimicrobia bacterium]|nr:hypothetical protein [Elusimicrobiota bacterium]
MPYTQKEINDFWFKYEKDVDNAGFAWFGKIENWDICKYFAYQHGERRLALLSSNEKIIYKIKIYAIEKELLKLQKYKYAYIVIKMDSYRIFPRSINCVLGP